MKSPPKLPSLHRASSANAKVPTLVVSNSNAKPFAHYLSEAQTMLQKHGHVRLSGVGNATQHALVVSEVLAARGIGRVTAVRTGRVGAAALADEHAAKIEVTMNGA
jgi:hypothetical protein